MISVFINAVGLVAPGLEGWSRGQRVLNGELAYTPKPLDRYKPQRLPANERRRASEVVRLAMQACEDAVGNSGFNPEGLASVFSSSGGDYAIIDQMCRALRQPQRTLSPTQFHNSVHNAPAGYWSIATGSRSPSTSLAGYDGSFGAGLLEAATQVALEGRPALLAVYDTVPPPPLFAERPIRDPFAMSLILTATEGDTSLACLCITPCRDPQNESSMGNDLLDSVRLGNPAARSLPLLEALARGESRRLHFSLPGGSMLSVDHSPC